MTPLQEPAHDWNPYSIQLVRGEYQYVPDADAAIGALLGRIESGDTDAAFYCSLVQRDVWRSIAKRSALFGRLNLARELQLLLQQPFKPPHEGINLKAYEETRTAYVSALLLSLGAR